MEQSRGEHGERLGSLALELRGRRSTPQDVNVETSKELLVGDLNFSPPKRPDVKHKRRGQREEDMGTSPTKSPEDSGRVVQGERHKPSSHIPGRPQTKTGQVPNPPEEQRREEEKGSPNI